MALDGNIGNAEMFAYRRRGVLAVLATGSSIDVVMACLLTWLAISVYREL
jgi:hypothetical protein